MECTEPASIRRVDAFLDRPGAVKRRGAERTEFLQYCRCLHMRSMLMTLQEHHLVWSVVVVDIIIRIAVGVRVVLRRQPVPAALAWLLLLLFVPFLSPYLYLLIGEHRLGVHRAKTIERLGKEMEVAALEMWTGRAVLPTGSKLHYRPISNLCRTVTGYVPVPGNSVELMDDASAVLKRLAADIDAAKHHCHLLYYIWQPANGGARVGEALIRAAKRGVKCRVLVDDVGAYAFLKSPLYERMIEGGVMVVSALPVNPARMLLARVDLRNHRKMSVIDGVIAYCGSQNLTDERFRSVRSGRRSRVGPWIDTTVRIVGPAVQPLQTIFLRDWDYDHDEDFTDLGPYFPDPIDAGGKSIVHVVPSGPGPKPQTIHQALLLMLYAAKDEIIMTTPYFVPDESMKSAIINASLRGVAVTLVVPDRLDAKVVAAAGRANYEELLEAGVKIMRHKGGLLHAKTATIDRQLALVTSANLDMRSFWLNFEVSIFVYDDDCAGMLRFLQMKYITESEEINLEAWRKRPIWKRFRDNMAQLAGPLL